MKYKNLFIIDDDHDDLEFFQDAIKLLNTNVQCRYFQNSLEGFNELASTRAKPDAIFLDLNMPLLSGEKFLTQMKADKQLSQIPVYILLTAAPEPGNRFVNELGASGYLVKPSSYLTLISMLAEVLEVKHKRLS